MKEWLDNFAQKHPKAAQWIREGGLFLIFSQRQKILMDYYTTILFICNSLPILTCEKVGKFCLFCSKYAYFRESVYFYRFFFRVTFFFS